MAYGVALIAHIHIPCMRGSLVNAAAWLPAIRLQSADCLITRAHSHQTQAAKLTLAHSMVQLSCPIKSPLDRRLYRRLQLDNGLQVLLIQDPEMQPQGAQALAEELAPEHV